MERGLFLTSCCSSAQRERSEQGQPELLLLPAGAAARLGKEMRRRCSGYRIVWLRYQLLVSKFLLLVVAEFLLSSRERMTLEVGTIFWFIPHIGVEDTYL